MEQFRGVSLGRFEAFRGSSDLSLWFHKSMMSATSAVDDDSPDVPDAGSFFAQTFLHASWSWL